MPHHHIHHYKMLHLVPDCLQPLIGFSTAGVSTATLWLSNVTDVVPGWAQGGAYLGLVGGLTFGCVTLWKELQNHRKEAAAALERREERMAREREQFIAAKDALEVEIRTDWKAQNARLIAVLEKLDPDK